jgi:hypothetical protein
MFIRYFRQNSVILYLHEIFVAVNVEFRKNFHELGTGNEIAEGKSCDHSSII